MVGVDFFYHNTAAACVVLLTLILCTLVTFGLGVAAYYKKSNIFPGM